MLNPAHYSCKSFETRPWGGFEVAHQDTRCKIKRLYILPHEKTSLQTHKYRTEHWLVEYGVGKVTLGEQEFDAVVGQQIMVSKNTAHRIENQGLEMLVIFEVQHGSLLCENDIIRLEDKYGRV